MDTINNWTISQIYYFQTRQWNKILLVQAYSNYIASILVHKYTL